MDVSTFALLLDTLKLSKFQMQDLSKNAFPYVMFRFPFSGLIHWQIFWGYTYKINTNFHK